VAGPIDYLLLWQWRCLVVAMLGSRVKQEHVGFLQGFFRVYLVPHRDDAGRRMWRECKELFGDRLRTVLVPEGTKDVGDLAEMAVAPARTFGCLVDKARRVRKQRGPPVSIIASATSSPLCVWGLFCCLVSFARNLCDVELLQASVALGATLG
jgi:hypothetical protein